MTQDHPVVLFDGVCNYCNSWVNFAIRNDREARLRFATLQSATGQELKAKYGVAPGTDSVILIDNEKAYTYSNAALRIAKYLRWPAKAIYALLIIPAFIREPVYKWIARNRYKWFGKKEECMVPSPEIKSRFL